MCFFLFFFFVFLFLPGMITIGLTLPSAPEVGGLDGSGSDTVEVIPIKVRMTAPTIHIHTTNSPDHAHYCMLWYTDCTCTIPSLTFHQQYHESSHHYRHSPGGREGTGVGVGVGGSVMSTL